MQAARPVSINAPAISQLDSAAAEPADELLARRAQAGDRVAYALLVERYYPRIHAFLYRMSGGDPVHADDGTQETFLRALRGLSGYQPDRPFRAWVFSIAANWARNHAASADQRHRSPAALSDEMVDETDSEEWMFDAKHATESVIAALHSLSPEQREVVTLYYYHDLPYADIASVLNIPLGTVKTRLWAAVRRLRKEVVGAGW